MTWIIFGDSHISAIRYADERGWVSKKCEFIEVGGATAVGLRNPNSATNALDIFRKYLLPPKANSIPVMHLGEVDCGFVIWWRAARFAESVEDQLKYSVDSYRDFVRDILYSGYSTVVITGATIPTILDGQDWGEVANKRRDISVSLKERTHLTIRYNAKLAEIAKIHNCPFIDISAEVLNPDTGVIDDHFRAEDPRDHHLHAERAGRLWARALSTAEAELHRRGLTPCRSPGSFTK